MVRSTFSHPIIQISQRLPWLMVVVSKEGSGARLGQATRLPLAVMAWEIKTSLLFLCWTPPTQPSRTSVCIPCLHCDLFVSSVGSAQSLTREEMRFESVHVGWSCCKAALIHCCVLILFIYFLRGSGCLYSHNAPTCCCDCRTWTVIWMLLGQLVMAHCNSHCTHSSELLFFSSCLSGTYECCSYLMIIYLEDILM